MHRDNCVVCDTQTDRKVADLTMCEICSPPMEQDWISQWQRAITKGDPQPCTIEDSIFTQETGRLWFQGRWP